ncbi:unnamed protein product [Closterium sp. NIES-64]|nr:unnamed protein product [Closterium sp. NIES-64]
MTGLTVGHCSRGINMNATLLLMLLACVFAIQAAPLGGRRGMTGKLQQEQEYIEMPQDDDNSGRANELPSFERSMELYRAWERVYGLADPAQPPARIALPPNVPRAPHLEDCSERSAFRRQTEAHGAHGEAPAWTSAPKGCRYPQPPWVRGSDAANLASTRQAQADIWLHQFPAPPPSASAQAAKGECGGRRLLVVPWPNRRNGIGSQIHIMSAWLNHALSHDRILVPMPGSFERANHSHCTGKAMHCKEGWAGADQGSFSCYFFPLVAPSCDEAALEAIAAVAAAGPAGKGGVREVVARGGVSVLATSPAGMGAEEMAAVLASDARVLLFTESTFPPHSTALAAREKGAHGGAVQTLSPAPVLNPVLSIPISLPSGGGSQRFWRAGGTRRQCGGSLSRLSPAPLQPLPSSHLSHTRRWGTAYLESRGDTEVMGRVRVENPPYLQVHWWRAQSFRFMLRWPSAYLCHLTNRARHEAYGLPVATRLVSSLLHQQNIIASLSSTSSSSSSSASPSLQDSANPDNLKINASSEAAVLEALSFSPQTSLETRAWPALGFDGCSSETHVSPDIAHQLNLTPSSSSSSSSSSLPLTYTLQGIVDSVYEGVGGEVYMPRPVVSVHVRQGDKAIEMELSSFASYMFLAHRLRSHTPDLQYAWLSTEMESVIQQSRAYKDWTFFYTRNKRQTGATAMVAYEQDAGVELLVGVSFANLVIASECDYFIGPLKSNWNRLINGLRMTNGRMNRGYTALNFGGW